MIKDRKKLMLAIFAITVVAVLGIVYYYWHKNTFYIETEDARVTGDMVKAVSLMSAKLTELDVSEGDSIEKDSIIGRLDMDGIDVSKVENSVIKSPIKGIVLKTSGTIGETIPAGAALAVIVDPEKLYVSANIQETKIQKVKIGQPVDITIDEYKKIKFTGTVSSIGQATAATFSLLPAQTGGTYTKVIQTLPVKIKLEKEGYNIHPGTNAVVKIHIK